MPSGTSRGRRLQSGSPRKIAASVSDTSSPSNARRPVSISYSTQPNAQMSDALVDRLPFRLLGAHVRRSPENHAAQRHRRRRDRRRHATRPVRRSGVSRTAIRRLRQTEVEHLHVAVGRQLDVRRLQIAMNDAVLVRGFERLGDLPRDRQRFVDRDRPLRDAIGERRPVDQLQHERAGDRPLLRGRRSRAMCG